MRENVGLDVLAMRLERLERENRWLKLAGVLLLFGIAASVVMGQGPPATRQLEAENLVIRDAHGQVRGWLGVGGEDGEVSLALCDGQGRDQIELAVTGEGLAQLRLRDTGLNVAWEEVAGNKDLLRQRLLKELKVAVIIYRNDVGRYPAQLSDVCVPYPLGPEGYKGPYTVRYLIGECAPLPCDPVTGSPFAYNPETGEVTAPE